MTNVSDEEAKCVLTTKGEASRAGERRGLVAALAGAGLGREDKAAEVTAGLLTCFLLPLHYVC